MTKEIIEAGYEDLNNSIDISNNNDLVNAVNATLEDLDKGKTLEILDQILSGKTPKPGSYRGRVNNEPENNRKTLMDLKNA